MVYSLQGGERFHRHLLPRERQEGVGQGAAVDGQGSEGALDGVDGEESGLLPEARGEAGGRR